MIWEWVFCDVTKLFAILLWWSLPKAPVDTVYTNEGNWYKFVTNFKHSVIPAFLASTIRSWLKVQNWMSTAGHWKWWMTPSMSHPMHTWSSALFLPRGMIVTRDHTYVPSGLLPSLLCTEAMGLWGGWDITCCKGFVDYIISFRAVWVCRELPRDLLTFVTNFYVPLP